MPLTSTMPKAEAPAVSSLAPAVAGDVPATAVQPRQPTEGEARQAEGRPVAGRGTEALDQAYEHCEG